VIQTRRRAIPLTDGAASHEMRPRSVLPEAVSAPSVVLPTIAHALDVQETPGRWLPDVLADALREQRLLVGLDNLENELASTPALVELLNRCPRLTLLITSRSPLRVSVEQRMTTPALSLPDHGDTPDIAAFAALRTIALFVARARAAHPEFALDADHAAAVIAICRRLDGLPLAIELDAVWVRVLPPSTLLDQLGRRLPMLHGGGKDQPGRLRAMRDAIAWSYGLLSAEAAAHAS
jgi:predicted ATPase